jgi:hypothetical protein
MRRLLVALLIAGLLAGGAFAWWFATTDWNELRGLIERSASDALGGSVKVEGAIRPTLSLTPTIALEQVRIEHRVGAPGLSAELPRSELRLSAWQLLLQREPFLLEARAWGGRIAYDFRAETGAAPGELEIGTMARAIATHVELRDVAVEWVGRDGSHHTFAVEHSSVAGCGQPLSLRGRLGEVPLSVSARVGCPDADTLSLDALAIAVRDTDLAGRLEVRSSPSLRIAGTLTSRNLVPADLAALGGGPSPDGGAAVDAKLPFEVLPALEADLDVSIGRVPIRAGLQDVRGHLGLEAGRLQVRVDEASLWGGSLKGVLEARPPDEVALDASLEGARLSRMLASEDVTGALDLKASVHGRGATLRALLADASGTAVASTGALEAPGASFGPLGKDFFGILFSELRPKERGRVGCSVVRSDLRHGIGQTGVVLDTPDVTLAGGGELDLREMRAELILRPAPKRASIGALKLPIRVAGPLDALEARVDKTLVAKEAGHVLAFSLLNPFLVVVPFIDLGSGGGNPCVEALAAATTAPPEERELLDDAQEAVGGASRWIHDVFRKR